MDGAGYDSVARAIQVRADVDDQRAVRRRRKRLGRGESFEPRSRVVEQFVEGATHG